DLVATVKVVVVGAGTSGLAAARTLTDTWDTAANGGPLELTVFEAGTRIGGRTWTLNAAEAGAAWDTAGALGAPTDMGASWIHGSTSTHPITKIATALNLAEGSGLVRTNDNSAELHLCTGEPTNDQYAAYESLLTEAQQNAENSATDIPLWQALSGLSSSGQTRDSELFQYHLAVGAEFNTAGPVTQLSAWYYNDDSQYSGRELVWAQGYKEMYEALQSGAVRVNDGSSTLEVTAVPSARRAISVTYSKRVTSVTYSSTGVVLTTADNSTYNADYVIITIPLGVLKSSDASSRVTFSPALPPATANGIAQLGFGNVVKIALLFPTVWWPTGTHYYGLAQAGDTNRGLFTYFLNVHALSAKPVLMTFALGAAADTAEGMNNTAVWAQIRANLVKIFPGSVTVPTTAPQMIRSTWRANPLAKGAYTYVAVGTSKNTITAAFGGNVEGRLFFAGEHTSAAYRGTVHGAFQTGQVAARAVKACSAGSCPSGRSPSSPSSYEDPCFPSEALVTMADGTPRRLGALRAGDAIVAARTDGTLTTDTVSLLSLADADAQGTTFVVLTTASGRNLTLTPTHHVPVGAACCADLKQAKDVAVGETVYEAVSVSAAVRATQVKKIGTAIKPGLHSPVLSHGTMPIVNGVATSFDALHNVRLASYGLPLLEATGLTATFRDAVLGAEHKYIA
ncbi:amine oxidase, partial [Chrysochromulina tobinii]